MDHEGESLGARARARMVIADDPHIVFQPFGSAAAIPAKITTLGVREARGVNIADLPPDAGIAILFDGVKHNAIHIVEVGSDARNDLFRSIKWESERWSVSHLGAMPRSR